MSEQPSVPASFDAAKSAKGANGVDAERASFLSSFALLLVAYSLAAIAGLQWATVQGAASPIWPAAGIAVACILHAGRRVWPAIFLGLVFSAQVTGAGHPWWSQGMMGLGNAAAAVLAAELLLRFGRPGLTRFSTVRSVMLLLGAAILGAAVSALNGVAALLLSGIVRGDAARSVLETWFFGDLVGILVVTALILTWRGARSHGSQQPLRLSDLALVCSAVGLLGWYIFFGLEVAWAWAIYPPLVWAALSLRVQGASVALVLSSALACAGTAMGLGPFGGASSGTPDFILLQQFLAVTGVTILLLAAAVDERNDLAMQRRLAESELHARDLATEMQRKLTLAMDVSRTGIWDWELATDTVSWTPRCYEIHGVAPGLFDGTAEAFRRLVHPDDLDAVWECVNGAIERREDYFTEFRIVRPDGTVRWVSNSGRAVYAADGKPLRMIGTITDITERKETQEKLTRLAERAEIAQQAARSSLYEFQPATGAVTRDPLIRDLAGYSEAELTEDRASWERVIHPDDVGEFRNTVSKAMERADRYAMEYRVIRKDGSTMWIADVGRIIRDDADKPLRIIGMASDVTERKAAEEELDRTNSLLQLIGDSTTGLLFAKDRDGRYIYANQRVAEVLKISLRELIGKDDTCWASAEVAASFVANDRRIMDSGVAEELDEVVPYPDGSRRLFRSLKAPLRDHDGDVVGIVGVATDITDRKATEEREQLLAREVDHRAKNLLAVVQSVVQMSRAEDIASFKAGVLGRIQSLARTHSLLAASRWDGVGLDQMLHDELAAFRTDDPGRLKIEGSPLRLSPLAAQSLALVIHELATNAAKYGALSAPGGRLSVAWGRPVAGGAVELLWSESAGRPAVAPVRSGFGSRLIRASVERQLGGELDFDWGQDGLKVRLIIPAHHLLDSDDKTEETAFPPPVLAEPAKVPVGDRCRVLVVEDETLIAVQLEQALEESGCDVIGVAGTVEEAMRIIDRDPPSAAVLDINLAGEKSYPIAERLRSEGVPFVFCTGYDGEQVLPEPFSDTPVIRKPFDAYSVAALFSTTAEDQDRPEEIKE